MDLKEKYHGKLLSTDEVADAKNAISKAIQELEGIELKAGPDYLLLKWGTLKGWDLSSDKGKELLVKYHELGSSTSAMTQHDTPEQKQIICEMIDECFGTISSDWSGEYYTKQQAKDYVMDYGKEK